jgi:hypothetical protein
MELFCWWCSQYHTFARPKVQTKQPSKPSLFGLVFLFLLSSVFLFVRLSGGLHPLSPFLGTQRKEEKVEMTERGRACMHTYTYTYTQTNKQIQQETIKQQRQRAPRVFHYPAASLTPVSVSYPCPFAETVKVSSSSSKTHLHHSSPIYLRPKQNHFPRNGCTCASMSFLM